MSKQFDSIINKFLNEDLSSPATTAIANQLRANGPMAATGAAEIADDTLDAATKANPSQAASDPVQSFKELLDPSNKDFNTWQQYADKHPDVVDSLIKKGAPLAQKASQTTPTQSSSTSTADSNSSSSSSGGDTVTSGNTYGVQNPK
jgi:hypothetical protein